MKKHYPAPIKPIMVHVATVAPWSDPGGPRLEMVIARDDGTIAMASFEYDSREDHPDVLSGSPHSVWEPTESERNLMMALAHEEMKKLKDAAEPSPTVN